MSVTYRITRCTDDDHADVGAYAWLAILHGHREQKQPLPPVLDSEGFAQLWLNGSLEIAVAEDEGEIIGVRVASLMNNVLCSTAVVVRGVTLFVDPKYRTGVGRKLGQFHNDYLAKEYNVWLWEELIHDQRAEALAKYGGYVPTAVLYVKG